MVNDSLLQRGVVDIIGIMYFLRLASGAKSGIYDRYSMRNV